MPEPFSNAFLANDDLSIRRAVNCLIKHEIQFAVIPLGNNRWQMSTTEGGVVCLNDNGIELT